MYKRKQIPLLFVLTLAMFGCKKEKQEKPEELQQKQIENVIPQEYLNILKGLGMTVYEGVNPPDVTGFYECSSLKLLKSNISTDVEGAAYNSERIGFSDFNNNDFSVNLRVKSWLGNAITSGKGVVSGSGNNFTVYSLSVAEQGQHSIKLAILISATKEGENLKNLKYGLINVDDINNTVGVLITEGQARVTYESDLEAERVTSLDFSSSINPSLPAGVAKGAFFR